MLVGFIWLGIRKRISLRDMIGGRWANLEDFFLDFVYAAVFWVVRDGGSGDLARS